MEVGAMIDIKKILPKRYIESLKLITKNHPIIAIKTKTGTLGFSDVNEEDIDYSVSRESAFPDKKKLLRLKSKVRDEAFSKGFEDYVVVPKGYFED
jgi:hypothetical protein